MRIEWWFLFTFRNGHARNVKGAGTPDSHKASSVFNFRYNISFLSKTPGELIVLDTDYKNYLVLMGIIPIAKIGRYVSEWLGHCKKLIKI